MAVNVVNLFTRTLSGTEFANLSYMYHQFMTFKRYDWRFERCNAVNKKHQVIVSVLRFSIRSNADVFHTVPGTLNIANSYATLNKHFQEIYSYIVVQQ